MRGHIYISRAGDRAVIANYLADFNTKSHAELCVAYNTAQVKGFFGAHHQGLVVIAMHLTFMKRWGRSPISVTDNTLIEFTRSIDLVGESWAYTSILN